MRTIKAVRHPAKFSQSILDAIALYVEAESNRIGRPLHIIDPFAGVGRVHAFAEPMLGGHDTVGIEIEPEWAWQHPRTIVGDALSTIVPTGSFDVLLTSPVYPNRTTDHHEAKDACGTCDGNGELVEKVGDEPTVVRVCPNCKGEGLSRRNTYRHALGRMPTEGSSAVLPFGPEYRAFHDKAWAEALRVLRSEGLVILNVSNHYAGGREVRVVEYHLNAFLLHGCTLVEAKRVPTPRNRQGANGDKRVDGEMVLVLRAPERGGML